MAAAPLYLPDMLPAPSYLCPRMSLRSSVSFSRVNLILSAIACPEVAVSQSTNSKNSSRIIPDWSTNPMIRGSCSLLATSFPSSAHIEKFGGFDFLGWFLCLIWALNYLGFLDIKNELAKKTGPPETSLFLQRQVTNYLVTALIMSLLLSNKIYPYQFLLSTFFSLTKVQQS